MNIKTNFKRGYSMYKMIALDMDGTLLNKSKEITQNTINHIQEARKNGVKVVLASGRPIEGLKKYLKQLDLIKENEYVLSYNGCLVQEIKSKKIIHEVGIKGKDLHYINDLSKKIGVHIHAFSPEIGLIAENVSRYTEHEAIMNGIEINKIDFNDIDDNDDIIKIMMVDEPEILENAIKKIPQEVYEKYTVVRSAPFFLEFINKSGDKGVGLKALANYLNIKKEEIIAMGDAGNDLAMIKYAGLGVAMGNATEEVKKESDYITKTNEEDGVANVINKFILN